MAPRRRHDATGEPIPPGVVELRVHGVGGTPPEEVLDAEPVRLVAGDQDSGFFRSADGFDPPREAYSWGGLTSAAPLRALWVLLAPFALSNLAGWMLSRANTPGVRSGADALAVATVRIYGLLLTVGLSSFLAAGSIGLLGSQCGPVPACVDSRWWLAPWSPSFIGAYPTRSAGLGAVAASLAVLAVAWLARRSQLAVHDRPGSFRRRGDPTLVVSLQERKLWQSPHVAHRLGLTHAAASLGVVGLTLTLVSRPVGLESWAGVGVLLLAILAVTRLEGIGDRFHTGLLVLAVVHLAVALFRSMVDPGPLFGSVLDSFVVPTALFPLYALGALAAGAAACRLWMGVKQRRLRTALTGPGLLLAGAALVSAFGSGLLVLTAELLGGSGSGIVYPDWVGDVAVLTVVAIAVTLAVAGVLWWTGGEGPSCRELAERYAERGGLDCSMGPDRRWARRVGRAEAVAGLTDRAGALLAWTSTIVLVLMAVSVVASNDATGLRLGAWADRWAEPASFVLSVLPVAAVISIALLSRSRVLRRTVGVVWDVTTFWPRWFHPWAPPSYGERAVPQLGDRLELLGSSGGVVVSAHSQGSVLAVAAIVPLAGHIRSRIALLTHGSPLSRLYSRYFPAFFGTDTLRSTHESIHAWVNLWRFTDFVGGRVEGAENRLIYDPPSSRPPNPGAQRPLPRRHSGYDTEDDHRHAVEGLASNLRSG